MGRHDEVLLDELQVRVKESPKAEARWQALTPEQLRPLVDWVCKPKRQSVGRRRVREAVKVLERPPLEEPGGVGGAGVADLLPSILDVFFRR
jgi:hypothetical protein